MRAPRTLLRVVISAVILWVSVDAIGGDTPFVGRLRLEPNPPVPSWAREPQPIPVSISTIEVETSDHGLLDLEEKVPLVAIVIEGNKTIATDEILKLIKTRPGPVADLKQIKEDVRTLIAKRWFYYVETRLAQPKDGPGKVLVFRVSERPILQKVSYVGSIKFTDKELTKWTGLGVDLEIDGEHKSEAIQKELDELEELAASMELRAGSGFDVERNREAVYRILCHYREKGYADAVVELEKGDSPDDREVVFKIDEGPQVTVSKISFAGNTSFDDAALSSQLTTKLGSLWNADGPGTDIDQLKQLYLDLGYRDVNVKFNYREENADDRSQAHFEYVIEEGPRYRIRHIVFQGNSVLSDEELREGLKLGPNDNYDHRAINADQEKILAQYGALGRIFARAEPTTKASEKVGEVDLIYDIVEDRPYTIGRVGSLIADDFLRPYDQLPEKMRETEAAAPIAELPGLRDIDRLVFSGITTFHVADIRDVLQRDFDLALAAHPARPLSQFLDTLNEQLQAGFRHCGFPDVAVNATVNDKTGRIDVDVTEGRRSRCGEVSIVGAKNLAVEKLVQSLTEDPKPSRILWKIGEPAPFDEFTVARLRERLEVEAAEAGFLSSKFDIRVSREPNQDTARLTITISDEGLPAVVGQVEITGTKRDSVEDLLKYLDLSPGISFDSRLPYRLERRLCESGRYLTIDVNAAVGQAASLDAVHVVRDLHIKLREYADAPKFADDLSPAEQALVKLGQWLDRWSKGEIEEDLLVTGSYSAGVPYAGEAKMTARMVVAPNRGQTIAVNATDADGKPALDLVFAAYPDRLVLAAPLRKAKLVLPNSSGDRLIFSAQGASAGGKSIDRGDKVFRVNFGMGFNTRAKPQPSAFGVKAEFSPAFLISLARFGESKCTFRGGMWEIRNDAGEMQIDATSGRLIAFRFHDDAEGWTATIRAEKDALKSELQALEGSLAAAAVAYDSASPWKSRLEFFVDAWLDIANAHGPAEHVESLRTLRKLVGLWSPPAAADIFDWNKPPRNPDDPFAIPSHLAGFSYDGIMQRESRSRKNAVGSFALPLYRRLVPKTGWLWPVGRDAFLEWASDDPALLACLHDDIESSEAGPGGELLLATIGPYLGLDLREAAGFAGIKRLAVEGFRRDYRPLLADDSWLGRWFLSLAEALRSLDESEIRALGRLLPAEAPYDTALACAQLLKEAPSLSLEQALTVSLDRFWSDVLRTNVSAKLRRLMFDGFVKRFKSQPDNEVRRVSAEIEEGAEQIPGDQRPEDPEPDPDENLDLEEVPELIP